MKRLIFDERNLTYFDRETGETIPAERLDEYAQGKLDEAIKKLASAWAGARCRFQPPPETMQ